MNETVLACCDFLRSKEFSYKLPFGFRPRIRFSWSDRRRSSRGGIKKDGTPHISMGMSIPGSTAPYPGFGARFKEYRSIEDDKVIGGIFSTDWLDYYRCLAAHETSHAVQAVVFRSGVDSHKMRKPHGQGWKEIYGLLRAKVVNPFIAEHAGLIASDPGRIARILIGRDAGDHGVIASDEKGLFHLRSPTGKSRHETFCGNSFWGLADVDADSENLGSDQIDRRFCPACVCRFLSTSKDKITKEKQKA